MIQAIAFTHDDEAHDPLHTAPTPSLMTIRDGHQEGAGSITSTSSGVTEITTGKLAAIDYGFEEGGMDFGSVTPAALSGGLASIRVSHVVKVAPNTSLSTSAISTTTSSTHDFEDDDSVWLDNEFLAGACRLKTHTSTTTVTTEDWASISCAICLKSRKCACWRRLQCQSPTGDFTNLLMEGTNVFLNLITAISFLLSAALARSYLWVRVCSTLWGKYCSSVLENLRCTGITSLITFLVVAVFATVAIRWNTFWVFLSWRNGHARTIDVLCF
eukprot:6473266-Amphidinium_carterae.1